MAFRSTITAAASVPAAYAGTAVFTNSRVKQFRLFNGTDVAVTVSLSGSGIGEIVLAAGASFVSERTPSGEAESLAVFTKGTGTTGSLNMLFNIEG